VVNMSPFGCLPPNVHYTILQIVATLPVTLACFVDS